MQSETNLQSKTGGFWPVKWWAIVDYKIGIIPLPVFLILFGVIGGFALTGNGAVRHPDGDRFALDGRLYLRRIGQANPDHP